MSQKGHATVDPSLVPFLAAKDGNDAERCLSNLLAESASSITGIVRSKLRVSLDPSDGSAENQDALDVVSDIQALIFKELQQLKNGSSAKAISDFDAYLAVLTYHACYQHLRRKYPERWRLKNRLRYLLTHRATFCMWRDDVGQFLCDLAGTDKTRLHQPPTHSHQLPKEIPASLKIKLSAKGPEVGPLTELLVFIFKQTMGPVVLDDLVSFVANVCDIGDPIQVEQDTGELADPRMNLDRSLEERVHLQQLWREICELPLRHRAAILLNLRDEHGRGVIILLPLSRVATIREIAEALEFPLSEFSSVWRQLPWDDAAIAEHLGVTRQQVINLRQSARARLARRMKEYWASKPE